tara:strand:- start:298 stop:741 length:444 start_codon:yes stop_codon:yes gene_type:complete
MLAVSAVGVLLIGVVFWPYLTDGRVSLTADNGDVLAQGAAIYAKHCASCHGKNLEGQQNWRTRLPDGRLPAPPHDETGHTWHHPDELLFKLTKLGPAAVAGGNYKSDMPAYVGTLTDAEIIAVLSYIKSTWQPSIRQRHDALNQRTP